MPLTLDDPARGVDPLRPGDHVVVATIRNEAVRLPYFMHYYRELGFDRFLMIDNDSSDGGAAWLRPQPDVVLYRTEDSYGAARMGMDWIQQVLDDHCQGHWVMVADADELLVWPGYEHQSIKHLTEQFDAIDTDVLFCLMVDMYSDRDFGAVGYIPGTRFLDATPFFDRGPYSYVRSCIFPQHMAFGGARDRMFHAFQHHEPPLASKVPLLRWRRDQMFAGGGGAHFLANRGKLAPMRGALLHFKLFDDAPARCKEEVERGEHHQDADAYRRLLDVLERTECRSFFDPEYSVRYEDSSQLVRLGLMNDQHPFDGLPKVKWTGRGTTSGPPAGPPG